jgi:transcription initiation factor IIF auxiliary subunit
VTLRIAQDSKPKGRDWWEWSAWLEGTARELAAVEFVKWILHSTFPDPIRKVTDRRTKFKLRSGGWGEFTLRARVHRTN